VEREQAIQELPDRYGVGLRLRNLGFDDSMIATALAIDECDVDGFIEMAESKLARLTGATRRDRDRTGAQRRTDANAVENT
jgi:hypothetical protein